MNKEIYLDHAASAPVTTNVLNYLTEIYAKKFGNSSSIHRSGVMANLELEQARNIISKIINCNSEELIFTSGATESNNLAIKGIAELFLGQLKNEIIISAIEHSSIVTIAEYLKSKGFKIILAPVDLKGEIDLIKLENLISTNTLLISIIHANNEIGIIQDLKKIGELCKKHNIIFHSDGSQAFCKTPINLKNTFVDLYSISGHKIHGPKGVGALFVRSGLKLNTIFHGGGQENKLRPGTVPIELCASMAYAASDYTSEKLEQLRKLKVKLETELIKNIPNIKFNSSTHNSLPNIINFYIPGFLAKSLLKSLDSAGIRVSVGSACNSGKKEASSTLLAIGLNEVNAFESIRVSLGLETTESDIDIFTSELIKIVI